MASVNILGMIIFALVMISFFLFLRDAKTRGEIFCQDYRQETASLIQECVTIEGHSHGYCQRVLNPDNKCSK